MHNHHLVFFGAVAALGVFYFMTRKPAQVQAIQNAADDNYQGFLQLVGADLRQGIVRPTYAATT